MPNFFGLDRLIAMTRGPNEVFFSLDPNLYFSHKAETEEAQDR